MPHSPVVLFDLEYTSWEGALERNWSGEREHREIVQIGALMVASETLEELSDFSVLITPRINPHLSDYFVHLTGLSNERVAREGLDFRAGYRRFLDHVGSCRCYAYGDETDVIRENLALLGLSGDLPAVATLNLRPWFDAQGVATGRIGSSNLARHFGLTADGRAHNAVDDCRSVLAAIRHLLTKGAVPHPFRAGRLSDEPV